MKRIFLKPLLMLLSCSVLLASCKNDDDVKAETFNNVVFTDVPESVSPTSTLSVQGYLMEHLNNKDIKNITLYVIKNSNLYESRVVVGSENFKKLSSSEYINSELQVTSTGPKSFENYNVQYNNYDFSTAIPLSDYDVADGDYLYLGVEIVNSDGTKTIKTTSVDIATD